MNNVEPVVVGNTGGPPSLASSEDTTKNHIYFLISGTCLNYRTYVRTSLSTPYEGLAHPKSKVADQNLALY